jgi:hypothetical protein
MVPEALPHDTDPTSQPRFLGTPVHLQEIYVWDEYSYYPGARLLLSLSPLMDGHQALFMTLASSGFREDLLAATTE